MLFGSVELPAETKERLSFESQLTMPFWPQMQVVVNASHFTSTSCGGSCDDASAAKYGTVLLYSSERSAYAVALHDAPDATVNNANWLHTWWRTLHVVEFVAAEHLSYAAGGEPLSVFSAVHLTGQFRVAHQDWDQAKPASEQKRHALFCEAVAHLHVGNVGHPSVSELIRRLMHSGDRIRTQRPDVYEETVHGFTINVALEKFALKEHIQQYRVEEAYSHLPDGQEIHKRFAIKLNEDGSAARTFGRHEWGDDDTFKDRQLVAGFAMHACPTALFLLALSHIASDTRLHALQVLWHFIVRTNGAILCKLGPFLVGMARTQETHPK